MQRPRYLSRSSFSIRQDKEASVLCVDPDRESRALLEDLLAEFNPVFADNAFDALLHLSNVNFDAYVLEMWLPDCSGLALCRETRRTDTSAPIVFCTGAAHGEDEERAMKAGARAYLKKTLEPLKWLDTLRKNVGKAAHG